MKKMLIVLLAGVLSASAATVDTIKIVSKKTHVKKASKKVPVAKDTTKIIVKK